MRKSDHIQTVVLVPVKVVGLDTQVFSTFITHNKFNPEHSLIQRLYWSVMMNPGQTHSVLFIPEEIKVILLQYMSVYIVHM